MIALINTVVVALICKRRKQYFADDIKSSSKNKSIDSSHSSGNNISLDESNGTENSLTFGRNLMTLNNNHNTKNRLFKDIYNEESAHQNMRRSLFISDFDKNNLIIQPSQFSKTLVNTSNNHLLNNANLNRLMTLNGRSINSSIQNQSKPINNVNNFNNNNNSNNNDPLSHIYETISVSSMNVNNLNNTSRSRYNINNIISNMNNNPYIEIESEPSSSKLGTVFSNNQNFQNDCLLFNPHQQTDYLNPTMNYNVKRNNQTIRSNQHQQRFLDVNNMMVTTVVNTSSPSCSSFTASTDTGTPPSSVMYNKVDGSGFNNQNNNMSSFLTDDFKYLHNQNEIINNNNRNSNLFMGNFHQQQQSQGMNSNTSGMIFKNKMEAVV